MESKAGILFSHLSLEPWACLPEDSWIRPLYFKFRLTGDGYSILATDWRDVWAEQMSAEELKQRIATEYPSLASTPLSDTLSLLSRLSTSALSVKPIGDNSQVGQHLLIKQLVSQAMN
jgi:hypothetical protein